MFEIGDMVRILPRRKGSVDADYSYFYSDRMEEKYAGKVARIDMVIKGYGHKGTIPDDGKIYHLDIDDARFNWASSMLEKYSPSEKHSFFFHRREYVKEITEVLKPKPKDKARYKPNFNI